MSASLIGRSGSSTFRLCIAAVSMSLAGSRFSSDSAPGPFHHGIRRRGGTILWAALPSSDGRSKRTCELTSSIVQRGTSFHHAVELEFSPIVLDSGGWSCRHGLPGPAELGAVHPDAVHNHSQPTCQGSNEILPTGGHTDIGFSSRTVAPIVRLVSVVGCLTAAPVGDERSSCDP